MSDSNNNRETAARQANQEQPSHSDEFRYHLGKGLGNTALKAGDIAQKLASTPPLGTNVAWQAVKTAGQLLWAGRKDYIKAGYHLGMGLMEGGSRQFPNSGQQLNNIKIYQALAQGRYQQDKINHANQERQNNVYLPKANKMNQQIKNQSTVNKGIEAARQKAAEIQSKKNTSHSTNQGLKNYQSKVSGQSTTGSKSDTDGKSRGKGQSR
jgi:hypothetical protein